MQCCAESIGNTKMNDPKTPHQRLETALEVIRNPISRLIIRRIYKTELKNSSIFWDEKDKMIEFVSDDLTITINENGNQL